MLQIVDSYYESHGNPGMLKCSYLEEYAASLGFIVKAYDFRRNTAVRRRIDELRALNGTNAETVALAYKSIDVDALLNRNNTRELMKNCLLELDETWRRIYERASNVSAQNASLLASTATKDKSVKALAMENDTLKTKIKSLESDSNALASQNRYLRKALKVYLYPAIANEILKDENVLEHVDTSVPPEAISILADSDVPASFSNAVSPDKQMVTREISLLERMSAQIGGNDNA